MIINKNYLIQRINEIIFEKQVSNQAEKEKSDKLYLIKLRFPKWLRSIVFHPFNPVYSVYLQSKARGKVDNAVHLEQLHGFASDFLDYFIKNDVNFDTAKYFNSEDDAGLKLFVDCRIKSILAGHTTLPLSDEQKAITVERNKMSSLIKPERDGFSLTIDSHTHKLPYNSFQEYAFMHDYGLKYISKELKGYIVNKVFMDVGAFWGDTAVMFLKYNPSQVLAYEPVKENAKMLQKAIDFSKSDKIIAVQKGIGDVESEFDIFINPLNLSSCSINAGAFNQAMEKETIQITTIDNEAENKKIGLIKMDIEGFEYNAIKGALETIKRDKPVLLISIYHTAKDFFEIPPLIKEIAPSYHFKYVDLEIMKPLIDKIIIAYPKL